MLRGYPESAGKRVAAGVVALDEREHHRGRDQARHGVDARVGVGGFQNFDASLSTPQVVEKRLAYMTPEWKAAFKYAVTLGDSLGMEEAIASSPGWSETGGPWVPPSQGMKKYVWSETSVTGGQALPGAPAHPPTNTGPFQNFVDRGSTEARREKGLDTAVLRRRRRRRLPPSFGGRADRGASSENDGQRQ